MVSRWWLPRQAHTWSHILISTSPHPSLSPLRPAPYLPGKRTGRCVRSEPGGGGWGWLAQGSREPGPGGAGSRPGGTAPVEIPCPERHVPRRTGHCAPQQGLLYSPKGYFAGPGLSRGWRAEVRRLRPGFQAKPFGSCEQIASPTASVPHSQMGTGTSADRIRCEQRARSTSDDKSRKDPSSPHPSGRRGCPRLYGLCESWGQRAGVTKPDELSDGVPISGGI